MLLSLVSAPLVGFILVPASAALAGSKGSYWCAVVCSSAAGLGLGICLFLSHAEPSISLGNEIWFMTQGQGLAWNLELGAYNLPIVTAVVLVTWVVVLFSGWYMASDPHNPHFLGLIQGFVFFMLCLLLAGSTPVLFLGWEGIGILSFLLISYWQTRVGAVQASMQGFVLNRVGDLGLILALVSLLAILDSGDLSMLRGLDHQGQSLIYALLLVGAAGKSAQLGLQAWLPSAMEAPTPVSALIHAATLVTAGVYLLACLMPGHLGVQGGGIALAISSSTLLLAGLVGLAQSDLKRTIAFSTCSQVAYMVLGLGNGATEASLFLLLTHAFYKALLFMAAGVVIHASGNIQDVRLMGGQGLTLPIGKELFSAGSLSLCAFPYSAGDFSKDFLVEQLGYAYLTLHHGFWLCGLVGSALTGAYSARLLRLAFASEPRGSAPLSQHEPTVTVLAALSVLGLLSVTAGLASSETFVPYFWESTHTLNAEQGLSPTSSLLPLISAAMGFGAGLLLVGVLHPLPHWLAFNQVLWELTVPRLATSGFLAVSRAAAKGMDTGVWEILGPHGLASVLWCPFSSRSRPSVQATSHQLSLSLGLLALLVCCRKAHNSANFCILAEGGGGYAAGYLMDSIPLPLVCRSGPSNPFFLMIQLDKNAILIW